MRNMKMNQFMDMSLKYSIIFFIRIALSPLTLLNLAEKVKCHKNMRFYLINKGFCDFCFLFLTHKYCQPFSAFVLIQSHSVCVFKLASVSCMADFWLCQRFVFDETDSYWDKVSNFNYACHQLN